MPSAVSSGKDDGFSVDLVRSMRCGLITVDQTGTIRSINQLAAQILELEKPSVGQPAMQALAAHPHVAKLLSEAATLATLPDRAEAEIRTRDHKGRTIGFTLSRVVGENGEVRGAALLFKDLTPIEQEEERQRLQERLAALGTMAASLAHEIRNPLAALELTTSLLSRKVGQDAAAVELVRTLQNQIRRLSNTVNRSLEYVRPLEIEPTPVDLAVLLDEALEAAVPEENAPKVTVVREFPDDRMTITADAARLRQAFLNLIRNALESMFQRGGVLRLRIEVPALSATPPPGSVAKVMVYDSGPGIPEDIRRKIFNPFFSTKPKGSGLGLPWTRKVIDAHGGLLDVESRPGTGTIFTIRLPLPTAANAPELMATGEILHEAQDSGC